MKGYRKVSGHYIEVSDTTPVDVTREINPLVEVALRPEGQVFTDNWDSDPMNPSVCWRVKTQPEIDAEKDAEATLKFSNFKSEKALALWIAQKLAIDISTPAAREAVFDEIQVIYRQLL